MNDSQKEFISKIYANCELYADKYSIKCVPAVVAQAVLESNFGKSKLASVYHNYFGLKCGSLWKGKSVNLTTKEEYTYNQLTTIKDNFRVYDDMRSGVLGYFVFISTKRYANLKGIEDPRTYLETILADGYATDHRYVSKCMNIIESYIDPWLKAGSQNSDYYNIAKEVIAGKWGNGEIRKKRLEEAGYVYRIVQQEVNKIMRGSTS